VRSRVIFGRTFYLVLKLLEYLYLVLKLLEYLGLQDWKD
jgi:hypothetical protein